MEWTAIHIQLDCLRKVSLSDGRNGSGYFCRWAEQIVDQCIDGYLHFTPFAARLIKTYPLFRLAFLTHHVADAFQFVRHALIRNYNFVEGVGNFSAYTGPHAG